MPKPFALLCLRSLAVAGLIGVLSVATVGAQGDDGPAAAKPLFRDPVFDGAADPVVAWGHAKALTLSSDRVIDPCVHRLPDGTWRMWYNNERDNKSIYFADSPDLSTWTDRGKAEGVGERPGEGPYVFQWKGHAWMLVDLWKGLGVYRSEDYLHWHAQPDNLLGVPGHGPDDGVNGGHPGVVISGGRAYCFYFTHPERAETISPKDHDRLALRRSSIQVVELKEQDGRLTADRDQPTHIRLLPGNAAGSN